MSPSDTELLKHILDEINFLQETTSGKDFLAVKDDPVLSRAIIRSLEIIGEASNKLDEKLKAGTPHIEWRKITNTRNKLIHNYFGVDYEIVWNIIVDKLPALKDDIQHLIAKNK